jgi:Na+-driven multidrug efflux pump
VFTAAQVVISVMMISFMSAFGFGSATGTLVGQALAAGRPALARRTGWEAAKIWSYIMWIIGFSIALVPDTFAALVNPDPEVIAWAHNTLRCIGVLQGLVAIAFVLSQTLYAVGEARFVAIVELGLHVLVMAPVAYLFGVVLDLQLVGLYLGPTCYVVCLGLAMAARFSSDRWQKIAF